MIRKIFTTHVLCCAAGMALWILPLGCGEDPGMYQGETLTFETPVLSKVTGRATERKKVSELDLGANDSSNFEIARIGALVPWIPYPLFDYYTEPFPLDIPVSPGLSLIEYIHPFYAYAASVGFLDLFDDGDDDSRQFRSDDE